MITTTVTTTHHDHHHHRRHHHRYHQGQDGAEGRETRLTLHLHDPEANEFATLFNSWGWLIVMQILIPLASLVVSANAFAPILIGR